MKITSISAEIAAFQNDIQGITALLGGTPAMREAGELYLPRFELEADKEYKKRLGVSTLTPYFEETVRGMNGRLFYKPADTSMVDDRILPTLDNFNLSGDNFAQIMESCSFEALATGRSWVVVDYYDAGAQPFNAAQEQALGARPYAYKVRSEQVMDVRYTDGNGLKRIRLFKYMHNVETDVNEFETKIEPEIVLFVESEVRRYRKGESGWYLHDTRELRVNGKPIGYPPIVELKYARRPPLLNLAEMNIKHWQSQSMQDNIVNVSRSPILFASGFKMGDSTPVTGMALSTEKENAKITYIEHSGAAIQTGLNSLDKLEEQMAIAGAKLLAKTRMALTDSQAKSEHIKEVSELQLYGMMLDDFASRVLDLVGMWLSIDDAGTVSFSQNINDEVATDFGMGDIISAVRDGIISKQTAYDTLMRRAAISGTSDWEEEKERIEIEAVTSGLPSLDSL